MDYIRFFNTIRNEDVPFVGGKNASLGEMISLLTQKGIAVPDGFATTSKAYRDFLLQGNLGKKISIHLELIKKKPSSLQKNAKAIRKLITSTPLSSTLEEAILSAFLELQEKYPNTSLDLAVRSSATAEDLPNASFAGQQESYLHIQSKKDLLQAILNCYASLFTDRAIAYRNEKGFDHMKVALSVGVQRMVRSDKACSGVIFTIDTETGFPNVVRISAAWGLGENVVQGTINPDEYLVFKPLIDRKDLSPILEKNCGKKELTLVYSHFGKTKNVKTSERKRSQFALTNKEILQLASWAKIIENHYQKPMDIEWAKDGDSGELFIVQARPETVESQKSKKVFSSYSLKAKGKVLLEGIAVGEAISDGPVQVIKSLKDINTFKEGSILVTEMTSPDWVPIMKKAAGIITDHGGRTSHAAIVSRELNVPAIVGTNIGTKKLKNHQEITLCCALGDIGYVYEDKIPYVRNEIDLSTLPKIQTQIMMNIATPEAAFHWWQLPCQGIGLARMEFIINNHIKIHPMALVHYDELQNKKTKAKIAQLTEGYEDKKEYFIDLLSKNISRIAASQYPHPVILRMSDFKTNEYANLIGGEAFEPKEENPMLGFRGASRYYNPLYKPGFALECAAFKRAREEIGLSNLIMMIPFCRTLEEADKVLEVLKENGLERGVNGLQIYVMCEIPSNVILAEGFAKRFDGFSIGSNDLTQLTLGIDRDSEQLSSLFDERNEAVKKMIQQVIETAHKNGRKVGICGQAPSDYPDFARFLIDCHIDSLSLNPDSVIDVILDISRYELEKKK